MELVGRIGALPAHQSALRLRTPHRSAIICRLRSVGPGPERDATFDRMLRRNERQAEALQSLTFPVLGLPVPYTAPVALTGTSAMTDRVISVELSFGDLYDSGAPVLVVRTTHSDAGNSVRSRIPEPLSGAVSSLDRLSGPVGGESVERSAEVVVEGSPVAARLVERDNVWALRAATTLDGVAIAVDVDGRAWSPSEVALVRVTDFTPFVAAQRARIERLRAQPPGPGPEIWDLPPARNLEAHEALVAMVLRTHGQPAPDRRPSPLPPEWARVWEAATRAQMVLAGQDRRTAEDAAHSLVNQLTHLAEDAPWFADQHLMTLAIEETIAYVARREGVASLPAQQAWSRYWDDRTPPPRSEAIGGASSPAEIERRAAWHADSQRRKADWLAAWGTWAEQQHH